MDQLGRETKCLGWNSVNRKRPVRALGREFDPEAQIGEKGEPEGVILIHVKYPWDADGTPWSMPFLYRHIIIKEPFILFAVKIRRKIRPCLSCVLPFRAHVASYMTALSAEGGHGHKTIVPAA